MLKNGMLYSRVVDEEGGIYSTVEDSEEVARGDCAFQGACGRMVEIEEVGGELLEMEMVEELLVVVDVVGEVDEIDVVEVPMVVVDMVGEVEDVIDVLVVVNVVGELEEIDVVEILSGCASPRG